MKFIDFSHNVNFDFDVERQCKSCDNQFVGRYCNRCGQRVIEKNEKSLLHFLRYVINSLTFLDTKFLRTLKTMVVSTGEVSLHYIHGKHTQYVRPLSMFLVINLLYFLFTPDTAYNSTLQTQMHFSTFGSVATELVEKEIARQGTTLNDFTNRYNQHSTTSAKLLLIVYVFLITIPISIINYSRDLYFVDHLAVSLEYNTLFILFADILMQWLLTFLLWTAHALGFFTDFILTGDYFTLPAIGIGFYIYFLLEKKVYEQPSKMAIFKSLLMIPCIFVALQTYRMILFFVTFYTL